MAEIKQGEFFIVGGQIAYVAEVGKEFVSQYDRRDSRLRVIYDNGTESDVLLRSLQRALHRDAAGRRTPILRRDRCLPERSKTAIRSVGRSMCYAASPTIQLSSPIATFCTRSA